MAAGTVAALACLLLAKKSGYEKMVSRHTKMSLLG